MQTSKSSPALFFAEDDAALIISAVAAKIKIRLTIYRLSFSVLQTVKPRDARVCSDAQLVMKEKMLQRELQPLLLIEDNPAEARLIREALVAIDPMQFQLVHVDRLSAACSQLAETQFAVILLDLTLPDSWGLDTLTQVRTYAAQTPIVVLTGFSDGEQAVKAVQEGAQDYLIKGEVDPHTLMRSLRYAIERQRLRQEIRTSEERYRNLFENASDAILSFTLAGVITDVNRGLETLLGWSRDELIEQHYRSILTPDSAVMMEERVQYALARAAASPAIIELEAVRKDYSIVPIEIRDNMLVNVQGQPTGVLIMARDISARKALEQQRTEFLAMLTHDIKNPVTAIMGYSDYLLDETGRSETTRRDEVARWIKSNAFTILSLVNNYLDLSRIEDKRLTLTKKPVNLNDLLHRVGQQYVGEMRHRHITLDMRLQENPPWVEGDHLALERIFANLIYNAVKFTPKQGRITINSTTRQGEIVVSVADTGAGIPAAEIPLLFGKYRQGRGPRRKEGTGLGLFIVKNLVEAHQGRIEVESEPGSGACFRVFLPLKNS